MVIFMRLFDRFKKPKREHKDPKVRPEGIREIDYQKILAEIPQDDSDERISRADIETIKDEDVLIDIAQNTSYDWDFRRAAIDRISMDNAVLIDIAQNDSDERIRKTAVEGISRGNNVLIDIFCNDSSNMVREAAIDRITDKDVLADIVKNDKYEPHIKKLAALKFKSITIDKIKTGHDFYNDALIEFEKNNYTTFSIYNLENHQVLMYHSDKRNITDWDNSYDTYSYLSHHSITKPKPNPSVMYISEDFTNEDSIKKRKYEYTSRIISSTKVQDPATDYWMKDITESSKFSRLEAIVIIGITDKITDLSEMFYGCKAETISFSNCDFSNVKNTHDIFYGCKNLKTIHADESSLDSLVTFVPESRQYIDNLK